MYDLIIIGAGPGGLTAAMYASRAKLKTLVLEKAVEGGQISGTAEVENYPGIEFIDGMSLGSVMKDQAVKFGAEFEYATVEQVDLDGKVKKVMTDGETFETKTIIIASGAEPRQMGVAGEKEFKGRGISYCATCDAAFYQDLPVYVIGGGDSAVDEALFIAKFAKEVYIVHRRDELRASKDLQDRAKNTANIKFIWDSVVEEIRGDKIVDELVLKNLKTGEVTHISGKEEPFGVFVFIGNVAQTKLVEGKLKLDKGYIVTDDEMRTNIDGVYAVGDVRKKTVRQVVTAAGDGAIAAINAQRYIDSMEGTLYEGLK
ncbi:thioredoxin-disulfide reductase [Peptoniphilus sp. GNH]|nr:thioredoxin-disulfide reductase [Clostridiales bacterium KA00134]UHR03445.1 thioredoxin-disulfide reductase [Peptoniphilus sp. GNH]